MSVALTEQWDMRPPELCFNRTKVLMGLEQSVLANQWDMRPPELCFNLTKVLMGFEQSVLGF